MSAASIGVIVLAGGRGTRMAGRPDGTVDKGSVRVHGQRLVDIVTGQLPYGTPVAVVSPFPLGRPQVCERPLFGGPVAGIAAGFRALPPVDYVAVLSVDAPESPQMLPRLFSALVAGAESALAPVAVTRAADGWLQPLCALWRADALGAALNSLDSLSARSGLSGLSARKLLRAAGDPVVVPGTGAERDYDTFAQLRAWTESNPAI